MNRSLSKNFSFFHYFIGFSLKKRSKFGIIKTRYGGGNDSRQEREAPAFVKTTAGKQRRTARFRISRYTQETIIWQSRQSFEFG